MHPSLARSTRLLPQAGALVRCHMSERQESGRAGCPKMLAFGQPGFQGPQQAPRPGHRLIPAAWRARASACHRCSGAASCCQAGRRAGGLATMPSGRALPKSARSLGQEAGLATAGSTNFTRAAFAENIISITIRIRFLEN